MADDIAVRFGAEMSGFNSGAETAKTEIKAVGTTVQSLNDLFLVLGGAAAGSFREMRVGAAEASEGIKGAAEGLKAFREAITGLGEAMIAAFAVEQIAEFAKKMGEVAEGNLHTAQTFGLTTTQVQGMKAEAALAGVSFDAMTTGMTRLDRAFANAKNGSAQLTGAFAKIGISTKDSLSQTDLFNRALAGLGQMADGPAKVAIAMQLFGRNIKEIAPLLHITKVQLEEYNATAEAYGAVNDVATQKGLQLAEAFNVNKVAGMGLMNVLTQAFAPALTQAVDGMNALSKAFVQSYNEGGIVRGIMDAIGVALKLVETAVVLVWTQFKVWWDVADGVVKAIRDVLAVLWTAISGPLHDAVTGIAPAFSGILAPVQSAIQTVIRWIGDAAGAVWKFLESIPGIGGAFKAVETTTAAALARIVADVQSSAKSIQDIWSGKPLPALPRQGTGTTGDLPTKKPKAGPDEVSEWREQLQQKLEDEKSFFGDSKAEELAFWQDKLSLTKEKSKEWLAVRHEIYALEKSLATQERSEQLEAVQAETQVAVDGEKNRLAVMTDAIAEREAQVRAAAQRGQITARQEYADIAALENEKILQQKASADAIYQIQLKGLKDREALYSSDPVNFAKVQKAEEILEQQHQDQITKIVADGARAQRKITDDNLTAAQRTMMGWVSPIVNAWSQGVQGMIAGTQSFRQAIANIGSAILSDFMGWISKKVEMWIVGEATQTGATVAGNATRTASELVAHTTGLAIHATATLAHIAMDAARAAAGAYAAIAGIPIIGPVLAPIAAGVALAAVVKLGQSMFSAEGGWGEVPADGMQTVLHRKEMVLPASIATPLRAMIGGGQAPGGAVGSGGSSPNITFNVSAIDGPSTMNWLRQNKDKIATVLRDARRNGAALA